MVKTMKRTISALLLSITALFVSGFSAKADEPRVVDSVDLARYQGYWNQIAFFPTRFQRGCTIHTTAIYTLRRDGRVDVMNACTTAEGERKVISGIAHVEDERTQAKLKVKFFWFAPAGDYWILDLGKDYEYSVVGSPDRDYLWILSRKPTMTRALYEELLSRVADQGFEVSRLQITGRVTDEAREE